MGAIILDLLVLVLLSLTIGFCWRLNGKIIELRGGRQDLFDLVKTLDNALITTHKSIANLREAATTANSELKTQIAKGEELSNDISFLNDAAAKLADKLELSISIARKAEQLLGSSIINFKSLKLGGDSLNRLKSTSQHKTKGTLDDGAIAKVRQAKKKGS